MLIAKTQDAETIRLNLNGQDGKKIVIKGRLSGTLKEFKEKAAAKVGVSKQFAHHLETHLSGYELEPDTKIMREFTELCEVIARCCCKVEVLIGEYLGWMQDTEIDLQGVEKANKATKQAAKEARQCPQGHALKYTKTRQSGWACDLYTSEAGCKRGCTDFYQSSDWGNYNCPVSLALAA